MQTWERFLTPMYRSLNGDDPRFTNLDDWDEDEDGLDPWKDPDWRGDFETVERAKAVEAQAQLRTGAREGGDFFELPDGFKETMFDNEPDEGWRTADKHLARRGRDPRRRGGSGRLIDLAKEFIGTPYVFGAAGPNAFDCSGFVKYMFSRVYGVSLPHQALQQQSVTQRISRRQLMPGDLIFYSYGRLGSQVDHVEIYMGRGKQIGTSNPTEDLDIDSVDWDSVHSFGRVNSPNIPRGGAAAAAGGGGRPRKAVDPMLNDPKFKVSKREVRNDTKLVPAMLSGQYGEATFQTVLADVLTENEIEKTTRVRMPRELQDAPQGSIKRQLYQGFIAAGRPDLARMVGTKDFATWVNAESGWRVDAVSPANNNGLRNDGLFQIWRGHAFNKNGQVSRMSPYEQAQIVAKYFDLSVNDIRRYAQQIRTNSYSGWG
jgi:hypothetical protein